MDSKIIRCPRCGTRDVRRSHKRTTFDILLHTFSRSPFRCRFCGRRFYHYEQRVEAGAGPLSEIAAVAKSADAVGVSQASSV